MAAAHFAFVDISPRGEWKQEFPPAFFEGGPYAFTVRPGVRPSDAVNAVFANPAACKFECGTAMTLVYYRALLDLLGPRDFDRVCAKLTLAPHSHEPLTPFYAEQGGIADPARPEHALKPGDRGYLKNWEVSRQGLFGGWQGENIIALGDGRFYGHPFGIETAESMIAALNALRKPGSARSASLTNLQGGLRPELFAEDLEPDEPEP